MASRIPIRRPRTAGIENDTRPSQAQQGTTVRGKAPAARHGQSQSLGGKPSSTQAVAPTKPRSATMMTTNKGPTEAPGSAKRKREALREVTDRNRSRSRSVSGSSKPQKPSSEGRKIVGLPKKAASTTGAARVVNENARPEVLAPVEEKIEVDEVEEPSPKRQRTSSVGPEEETRVAAELALYSEDDDEAEEADPDGDDWVDLDAADDDDPTMASEYVVEIQEYLRQAELTTMPNPKYIASQPDLNWSMRGLLNEWLIQVHSRFQLLPETLFLCGNLIDRFLSTRVVSTNKVQLVGMACLLIAAKYEETVAPAIENYVLISDGATTSAEMRTAEQHILRSLDWDLRYTSPMHFLRRISKADNYAPHTRTLGKYLSEISLLDHRLLPVPPSQLAAAAMWLAKLALGEIEWTPTLAHYAGYRESALIPAANVMLRFLLQPTKYDSFYKKYAGKRNLKVAVFMHQWVRARWPEGTKVDLALDLPALKREIRLQASGQGSEADDAI